MAEGSPRGGAGKRSAPVGTRALRAGDLITGLQEYITEVETIAENRGRELQKTKEQKQQLTTLNKQLEQGGTGASAALDFDTLQGSEVPPRIRALIEDAKGLKVRVKKYKDQCAAHERTITSQQSQIARLADKAAALEGAVRKLEKDPDTVLAELRNAASAAEKVAAAEEKVREMEHRLSVVTRSKETELKKFRIAASGILKEREAVEAEVDAMRAALEEKDKEARVAAIKIRQLKDKMKPRVRSVPMPLDGTVDSTFLTGMGSLPSMTGMGSFTAPLPPLTPAAEPVQLVISVPQVVLQIVVRPPEQTHVMLCLVRGEGGEGDEGATEERPAEKPAATGLDLQELEELEEAAAKIQGVARRRREETESAAAEHTAEDGEDAAAAGGDVDAATAAVVAAAMQLESVPEAGRASEPEKPRPTAKKSGKQAIKHK